MVRQANEDYKEWIIKTQRSVPSLQRMTRDWVTLKLLEDDNPNNLRRVEDVLAKENSSLYLLKDGPVGPDTGKTWKQNILATVETLIINHTWTQHRNFH